MTNGTGTALAVLGLGLLALGCDGRTGPTQPVEPSELTVTGIAPTAGSTGGDTFLEITGTGFHPAATVSVGGINTSVVVQNGTTIHLTTEAHPAGQVDIVVTNPDGQTDWPSGGYIYAPPESFDFNGTWVGGAGPDEDTPLRFTIQDNLLTSLSCGVSGDLPLSPPSAVSNGVFLVSLETGATVSGRIVSSTAARGTISLAGCPAGPWVATRL